jgi:hypothetical protein
VVEMDFERRKILKYGFALAMAAATTYESGKYVAFLRRQNTEVYREVDIINNPKTDDATLIALSRNRSDAVRRSLAFRNYPIPRQAQIDLSNDYSIFILSALSQRKDLLPEVADNLLKNNKVLNGGAFGDVIIANIAQNRLLYPQTIDVIANLADYSPTIVYAKISIADRSDVSSETLNKFAKSSYFILADAAKQKLKARQ